MGLCLVLAICGRLLVSILLHPLKIGWDPALHLMCAALITQGKLPYVDMFDVNPPLIWYINTLPASLATLFDVPITITFNLFLLVLITISGLACVFAVVKYLPRRQLLVHYGILAGLLLFNLFLNVDFGQREEIFVLLFMPFVFLRLARWQKFEGQTKISLPVAIFYGVLGAFGVFMKHYFVLNFLAVEIFFLCDFSSIFKKPLTKNLLPALKKLVPIILAPEMLTVAVLGLAYLGHFMILPAAVRHNYFDFLVPAFAKGYYFWDTSVSNCLAAPAKRDIFLLSTAASALAIGLVRRYPMVGALISYTFASIIVYLLQFKGWAYQDIPVMGGGFMLAGAVLAFLFVLGGNVLRVKPRLLSVLPYAASCAIALWCATSALGEIQLTGTFPRFDMKTIGYRGTTPQMDVDGPFTDVILKYSRPRDPIVFVSNAVAPGFPITMQLRRSAGSRHLHVCILSVLQYIRSSAVRDKETQRLLAYDPVVVQELGQDILKNRPPLVFVQIAPIQNDYFAAYDFSKRYLYRYTELEPIIGFAVYRLDKPDAVAPAVPPFPGGSDVH